MFKGALGMEGHRSPRRRYGLRRAKILRLLLLGVVGFWTVAVCPVTADTSSSGGRLEGTVVDPQGGPLAALAVTARNMATGLVLQQPSDPDGRFVFPNLPPGAYEVTITATRFWVLAYAGATTRFLAPRAQAMFEASEQVPEVLLTPEGPLQGTFARASIPGIGAGGSPGLLGSRPDLGDETNERSWPRNSGESGGLRTPEGAFGTSGTLRLTTSLQGWTRPENDPFALSSPHDLPPPTGPTSGEEVEPPIALLVKAGTPLRVALDERVTLRRVGQPVLGTLVEPVYSYDRVVLPAGAKVVGHVEKLESLGRAARLRAILRGDLTPLHRAILRFDTLVLGDCTEIPLVTEVDEGRENVSLEVAATSPRTGRVAQARQQIAQRMDEMATPLKGPDKLERLKEMLTNRLPYHPQYLHRGTVYSAELLAPLNFGNVTPTPRAAPGTPAPPESVLAARLLTPLDSAKTPRGTPIRAVVTEPLFSAEQRLILPEGAELQGEVTFAKGAGRFHHNGQLRFLFETVQLPGGAADKLLASLYSAELGQDQHIAIDEEGGASVPNSKTRFISPAVALVALGAARGDRGDHHDADDVTPGVQGVNPGGSGVAGFLGLGVLGAGLGQLSRPVALALGVFGVARRVYSSVLGRGREVVIPARTPIQLQLSPASTTP
jgi:hypothetical protein